ncbi:hypothetical protein XELAEV_18026406mg [Xenopus laevis]|uniref:Endonuclease/exonuclease/phosphatase domain-containing protein n=1 Tax=Xenopus laevis TaxID=8355 RepID=A0A974CVK6_XENLA|nr:hypothetical protein XELAEV_18026406mg [Xenopus laevis]
MYLNNNPVKKAAGVMILLHDDLPFEYIDSLSDTEGRYITIKGKLAGQLCTIANVYVPNSGQIMYIKNFLKVLEEFSVGRLIVGGDFNLIVNSSADKTNAKCRFSYKDIKEIKFARFTASE